MSLHSSTFQSLKPTEEQLAKMQHLRDSSHDYCRVLEELIPDGPDKTYLLRKHREVAMWANVAVTRQPDGSPRE